MNEYQFIKDQDPELYATLIGEEERERKGVELNPSENYESYSSLKAPIANIGGFTKKYLVSYDN